MKKEKELHIDKVVQPGDPEFAGPLIKSPDGDVKDKSITLIVGEYRMNNFVNSSVIRSYATTAESIINNMNHFYFNFKHKCYEEKLISAIGIDTDISKFILRSVSKSKNTDTEEITNIIMRHLDTFFEDEYLADVAEYVIRHMYYDEEVYDNNINNYEASLDPVGVCIVLMISVISKQIWLVCKRVMNPAKIKRQSISLDVLKTKVNIECFEKAIQRCSYVYCNTQIRNWDGEVYNFQEKFMKFFMDRMEKTIDQNLDFIDAKHSLLGTTEASIVFSSYEALYDAIRRLGLSFGYKPELLNGMSIESYLLKYHKYEMKVRESDPEAYVYIKDLDMFGFNMNRVSKYIMRALAQHVAYNGPRKKEEVIVSVAEHNADAEDQVSRRDKLLKKEDIINPEQKRVNEQIKVCLIDELRKKLDETDLLDQKSTRNLSRNTLNITLMSMYLDAYGIRVGNPLTYMNMEDFSIAILALRKWELLEKYPSIREALISEKNTNRSFSEYNKIEAFIEKEFSDYINKDVLMNTIVSILEYKYTKNVDVSNETLYVDVEIVTEEMLNFLKDFYELMKND